MNRHFTSAAALILASTAALSSAPAFAVDAKVYSPLNCRHASGFVATQNSFGGMQNLSFVNPSSVICPVDRDRPDANPASVQVTVVNRSTLLIGDGKFKCRLGMTSRLGTAAALGAEVQVGDTGPAGQILSLPLPAASAVDGSLNIRCTIPRRGAGDPASTLGSIKIIEQSPTD